jgi:hypothetical protein
MRLFRTALALIAFASVPMFASDLWFHLKVENDSPGGANVKVNLPLGVVHRVADHLPAKHVKHCSIDVDGDHFSYEEMRGLVQQTIEAKDGETLTLRRSGATVLSMREAERIKLYFHDEGRRSDHVELTVPLRVAAAMVASDRPGDGLRSAIRAVGTNGVGEVITVRSDDATVRMWIDRSKHAE